MKIFSKLFLLLSFCIFANGGDLNFNKIVQEAQKEDKSILVFFHINGCRFCESMLKESFKDKKTLSYMKQNFIHVDINISDKDKVKLGSFNGSNKEFGKKYEIFSYPSTLFLDKDANVIYTDMGYKNMGEFVILLKYIKTKKYKSMKLEDFSSEAEFLDE